MSIKKVKLNGNNADIILRRMKAENVGVKIVYWSSNNFNFLKEYVVANDIHSNKDILNDGFEYFGLKHYEDGMQDYYNVD